MKAKTCYDCGAVLPSRDERKAGARHVCVELAEPEPGTTCYLETYDPDPFMGAYGVDIKKDGKTVAGLISDRGPCERLLRVRGFRGPYLWPTVAESKAKRAADRAARKAARKVAT